MPKHRTLTLTEEQQRELLTCRDRHKLPYMRERAAALLFVAAGIAPAVGAREKLWRFRDPDTLYSWLDRYQEHGLAGLLINPGRGRKPAFSPSLPQ
jgi:Helix-turn-helix domain